jgi:Kef-type K+ transport system membrane component KefB
MPGAAESLFWISLCAVLAPLLTGIVLRGRVPEVVLLLGFGVVIGPNVANLASSGDGVEMLRQLGLGMLFLLAGYEIRPAELTGAGGRRALAAWLVSLMLALGCAAVLGRTGHVDAVAAVGIALTSTALGTLLPILKDGGLLGTAVGRSVLNHGAWGELGPIVAMAVLLGVHGPVESLLVLAVFGLLAVVVHRFSVRVGRTHVLTVVRRGAETSGQTQVRLVVLLLVTLTVAASVFDLDAALGSFAAGFVLRQLVPEGNESLEHKLEGLAFGLLIPVFFITSGMAIDPVVILEEPIALVTFVVTILVVRGGVVLLVARTSDGFDREDSVAIGLFASTGLPVIVAVSSVAVSLGEMSTKDASVLVAGGAVTVLVCPLLAQRILTRSHPDRVSTRPPSPS